MRSQQAEYLLRVAQRSGREEELKEDILGAVMTGNKKLIHCLERDLLTKSIQEPYPFTRPPVELVGGPIEVGQELSTGKRFGIHLWELAQAEMIGKNQQGKTNLALVLAKNLAQKGINVHLYDPKESCRKIILKDSRFSVLSWDQFKWNPLAPPVKDPKLEKWWVSKIIELLNQLFDLLSGSASFNQNAIYKLFKKATKKGRYPTFFDLKELLEKIKGSCPPRTIRHNYAERCLERVRACLAVLGEVLKPAQGFPIQELAQENIVFEWGNVSTRIERFLILSILLAHYFWRKSKYKRRGKIQSVQIFDEAEAIFDPRDDRSFKKGVPFTKQLASRSKELGMALICLSQTPDISQGIKDNAECRIAFSTAEDHLPTLRKEFGLTTEQLEVIPQLPVGHALIKLPRHSAPFVVKVDLFDDV